MSSNYHTPLTDGPAQLANAAKFNGPLGELDAALTTARVLATAASANALAAAVAAQVAMDAALANGTAVTAANGAAAAGQKVVDVDSTAVFLAGCAVEYQLASGVVEYNTVAAVNSATRITLTTNIGTGGIPNDGPVAIVPRGVANARVGIHNVRDYGALPSASGATNAAAFAAALAAASEDGVVYVPAGEYTIEDGLEFAGLSCSFMGHGLDTVLKFANLTKPCLDLDGYVARNGDFQFGRIIGDLAIEGDNAADPTGTNCGLYLKPPGGSAICNIAFRNLSIRYTGGPAIRTDGDVYFNLFENVDVQRPVAADSKNHRDVYLFALPNGNQFQNLMLRNMDASTDPLGGVLRIERDASIPTFGVYAPSGNRFFGLTTENLKIPDGGQVIYCQGISNTFDGYSPFDTATTATDADDTCHIRLIGADEGGGLTGGNIVTGIIPGGFVTGYAVPRYGVIIDSDRECIIGAAGYAGYNVKLVNTADQCYVNIGGLAEADWSGNTPITDASSGTKNVLIDNVSLRWRVGGGTAGATAQGFNFYKALGNLATGLTQGHLIATTLTQPHAGGGSIAYGLNNYTLAHGANAMSALLGLWNLVASSNTAGALTTLIGMLCEVQSLGAGAITNLSGLQVALTAAGAGDVTTYKAVDVLAPSVAGGPVATAYGVYLAAQKQANVTAAYGVRQVGASDINQFDGPVRVGSLGVGNSAAGSTPGTCVKKIQVFDAAGNSLGYVPVYDAIT